MTVAFLPVSSPSYFIVNVTFTRRHGRYRLSESWGIEKLYIGVPITMSSAALSSPISSSEIAIAAFISGECCSTGVNAPPIHGRSTHAGWFSSDRER